MAVYSSGRTKTISPERTKIWVEPKPKPEQKVSVVYYLSRNGQLEHPHYIEVPLSIPQGLYLRDVIARLNSLRGQGMANMYFWSSKRSFKNGFVWQDLSENDFIYPCRGNEYILKGSQILEHSSIFRSYETALLSGAKSSVETSSSSEDSNSPATVKKKNHSWSSFSELNVYKIYKAVRGTDASTQTGDNRTQQRLNGKEVEDSNRNDITELSGEEVNLIGSADIRDQTVGNDRPSRRMKAPTSLIQLITCGSGRYKDCQLIKHKE
ncbi:hypothetical protein Q3G72_006598 [Acer saccharum]|nr:hypothetical protein Q3G72_006598 [Acer saccharum]